MKIEKHLLKQQTLESFALEHDLTLVITENLHGFTASFKNTHERTVGEGHTEGDAIYNYAGLISGRTIHFEGLWFPKPIRVPILTVKGYLTIKD